MNKQGSALYNKSFFEAQQSESLRSAQYIVPLIMEWIRPKSVIDVGCGVGSWLSVFKTNGVPDILGIDGDYVNPEMLLIPLESFMPFDLTRTLQVSRRFDLVISLEVAEHLPPQCAESFVQSLVSLGDVVLFSAAIPKQGWDDGKHLNEQWPDYWANLFRKHGYEPIDCIRRKVWANDQICWWYVQNILLFVKRDQRIKYVQLPKGEDYGNETTPLSIVHPRFLNQYANFDGMSFSRKIWLIKRVLGSMPGGFVKKLRRFARRWKS